MDVINAMFLSGAVGVIVAIPAFISEIFRRGKNLPILMDVNACWGKKCTAGETFALSIFTHFLISIAFGGIYMFLVLQGWGFHNFNFLTVLVYGIIYFLFVGVVIFPIVGLGFFAKNEGSDNWFDMLISHLLLTAGFWFSFSIFPVFLP